MTSYKNADPRPPIMAGSPVPAEWRVPRALWDAPPWNRWSFQNVRQILPTVAVAAGTPSPLIDARQDINDIAFDALNGPSTVAQMLEETYTDGFIVLIGGKVVSEQYFNAMQPDTLHLAQSVSKSVVATVAGILIGRGLLDPAAPITDVLPELAQTGWNGATLQHVLDMTSGTAFDEGYTSADSDIAKTDVAAGWRPRPENAEDWPDCVWDQITGLGAHEADHGARFKYRSIETDVLAHAMERVTGTKLAQLVSTELWQKIGAEHDACFTVDSAGYALADGGFNASLRDFARFGQVLLEGGRGIVPAGWIDDIRRGPHGLFNDEGRMILPNGTYRNQFWIEDQSRESFMCLGVFGQLIYVAPDYDMVAVKLSTWPDFVNVDFKIDTLRALHAIARAFAKG